MSSRLTLPTETQIKKSLRLDSSRLPGFPRAAARLIKASREDVVSLKDFAKILQTDPGLCVQVLRIVNSPVYGLDRKITTLSDAVAFLGMDEIRKQAIRVSLFQQMFKNGRANSFDMPCFRRHALSVAVLGSKIARAIPYPDPDEAYVAGLLHDVGKVFLAAQGRTGYGEFIRGLSPETELVIESERGTLGLGHDEVGAWFCDLWKLPENLTAAVRYHHETFHRQKLSDSEKILISIVSLADFLCWTQGIGSFAFIRPPVLAPEVEEMIDLDQDAIIEAILDMNREMETIAAYYDVVFPLTGQLQKNLYRTNLSLSRISTRYFFQTDTFDCKDAMEVKSFRIREMELEFGKSLARAKSVKEVLDIVMYQIGRIFEPRHWSILLKNPKTGNLVFSVVIGENKKKLQGVKLAKGEGIAGYILETGQSLVVEDVSKDSRFSSRVDKYTGFRTRSIIGTPLKTGDKVFGVIELINRIGETPFDEKDLALLSSIAEYAAIAVERSYYTQTLTRLAANDPLTGLKNRWSFERALVNKNEFEIQYGSVFSMLVIRVGGLDRLVQAKGQKVCDDAVKALARIIDTTKRRTDTLFRYSENIFLMLLPLTFADGAEFTRDRIKDAIHAAVQHKQLLLLEIHIVPHTLSSRQIKTLIPLVGKTAPPYENTEERSHIADIQENLQPLVEQETREDPDKGDQKKLFGKAVSLMGHYQHPKKRRYVHIKVDRISIAAIEFRIPESEALSPRDFLNIQFVLDDKKRSVIKRQVIVREVDKRTVYGDFYNPPPYAKNLGFYLIG
ncbi:MAG: HDOD domain-containing protein [Desulfotignum sp.]|nr:HDOD domain-containing protein [Desulfotignum sp.]